MCLTEGKKLGRINIQEAFQAASVSPATHTMLGPATVNLVPSLNDSLIKSPRRCRLTSNRQMGACLVEVESEGDKGVVGRDEDALHARGDAPLRHPEGHVQEVERQSCTPSRHGH
jgi:hypothetical protein